MQSITNPQGGSASSSSGGGSNTSMDRDKKKSNKSLPPLFWYMEKGFWEQATERAQRHPEEVRTWATLRTKSMTVESPSQQAKVSGTKRLALHHACFKLRSVVPGTPSTENDESDAFVAVCKFILLLVGLYPEAAGMRESRHGCLPLHLAAFASCAPRPAEARSGSSSRASSIGNTFMDVTSLRPSLREDSSGFSVQSGLARPSSITAATRNASDATVDTSMTAVVAEERYTGTQTLHRTSSSSSRPQHKRRVSEPINMPAAPVASPKSPSIRVSQKANVLISARREDLAVQVLNALLDAYPKGIRVDSEGGRLPLHTACAGRATPRVISTLLTAYPSAARHRNKDGFLPLHLSAHWGVSHPNVAITLLKTYPDATLGRNRWERTPLEEALCMAGENGRPHQAALVRALRKPPSYWTRPPAELFASVPLGRREGHCIVDMDISIPSDETSEDDERHYFNAGHTQLLEEEEDFSDGAGFMSKFSPRGMLQRKYPHNRRPSELEKPPQDLASLIKQRNWDGVIDRLECEPNEASEHLKHATRGGFSPASGLTPLAYALERRPPDEVIVALLEASPEAVTTRLQPGGSLPLHIACTWHASPSIISLLASAEPAACRTHDDMGNLPLHAACFSGAPVPVVDLLLRTFPKSVLARNNQGSLAGDIVKRLRHDNRRYVMELLHARMEQVMAARHRRGRSSGSSASVAKRAAELNARQDARRSSSVDSHSRDQGIEVPLEEAEGGDMLWI